MSRYISTTEFWDQVRNSLMVSSNKKGKKELKFDEKIGNIHLNHLNTGFGIKYFSFVAKFNEDTIIQNTNTGDSSFLCFNTGGDIYMEDSRKKEKTKWDSNICWNGEQYNGHKSHSMYSKNTKNILHYVTFEKKLYDEITQENEKFKKAKSVYKGDYIDVKLNNYITNKQKVLLNDLLQISGLDSKLQELYIESKLLDLVYTTINNVDIEEKNNTIYLSSKDIESLHRAKEILITNMENPPSLKTLAYKSAINEFKLKKGFKQIFGNTVFGYLQEYRLNEAKKLLENDEINISEASLIVGYKSISHFSKIFKEHFGIAPIEIKKEQKKIYLFNTSKMN